MKNRNIPFGYTLKDGAPAILNCEAETVKSIFAMYAEGFSFLAIAKALTESGKPYIDGVPRWYKNNVARILRNEKYIGADGYPQIIEINMFENTSALLACKKEKWAAPADDPSKILWELLVCGECGSRLLRIGGRLTAKGIVQLRCAGRDCPNGYDIPIEELNMRVSDALNRPTEISDAEYEPTADILRMENEISRLLQRPESPEEIRQLILRAAAARYEHIWQPRERTYDYEEKDRPGSIDWKMLKEAVSHISIDKNGEVSVQWR